MLHVLYVVSRSSRVHWCFARVSLLHFSPVAIPLAPSPQSDVGGSDARRWSGRGRKKRSHGDGLPPSRLGSSGGGLTLISAWHDNDGAWGSLPLRHALLVELHEEPPGWLFGLQPCRRSAGRHGCTLSWRAAQRVRPGQRDATLVVHDNRACRERHDGPAGSSGRSPQRVAVGHVAAAPHPGGVVGIRARHVHFQCGRPPPMDVRTFTFRGMVAARQNKPGGGVQAPRIRSTHPKVPNPADKDQVMCRPLDLEAGKA